MSVTDNRLADLAFNYSYLLYLVSSRGDALRLEGRPPATHGRSDGQNPDAADLLP
jgi:hypothetical protein